MRAASGYALITLACFLAGMAVAPCAQAQQADDEPVGWPLPKHERPGKAKSERRPLLPVAPAPQPTAADSAERVRRETGEELPADRSGSASSRLPAATAASESEVARTKRAEEKATVGELAPLEEVTLGAKPLVFAFAPDQYALSSDDVRQIERFAAGVRAASGIVDVVVWVTPPAGADEQVQRKALERAFARGLYLRALLREAGLPASRIDILATAQPAPQEKDMPSPSPAEGARIRLVSNFTTGVR